MKKLMVVLAAVALVMGVNAASVDWQIQAAGKGADWASGSVMAFDAAKYSTVISLLTETGSDDMATALSGLSVGSSGFTNARGTALSAVTKTTNAPDSIFWVVFETGSTDAGSKITWTAATDVKSAQYTPPASGTTLPIAGTAFTNSGTIASVPEPTSALLLILGMAGLALKRKRG